MTDKKICTTCRSSFDTTINLKNGEIYKTCVACRTHMNKRTKEKYNERRTEYLELYNEEIQMLKIVAQIKKYDKKKEYDKKYREENKDKINDYSKNYKENNKDKIKEYYEKTKEIVYKNCECECCGKYNLHNRLRHERSSRHQLMIKNKSNEDSIND